MIPIVFSTDHNYVMPTGVTITSLLNTNKNEEFDIFILCGNDVSADDKASLSKQVAIISSKSRINFIHLDSAFAGSHEIRDISIACYYRLLIPWLIPQYDKIIYSDVDIIFRSNITDFFEQDISGYYVAGVNTPGFTSNRKTAAYIRKLGIAPDKYINSGFLLINSARQRKDNLKTELLELSKKKYLFQDQDIINLIAKGRIKYSELKYNAAPGRLYPHGNVSIEDAVVLHYAGDKPWKTFTLRWREWWDVFDNSVFRNDWLCEKVSADAINPKLWIKNTWKKLIRYIQ